MDPEEVRTVIINILKERKQIEYDELVTITGYEPSIIQNICKKLRFEKLAKDIDQVGIEATPGLFIPDTSNVRCEPLSPVIQITPSALVESSISPGDYKIFISYGHAGEGLELAERIERDLSNMGFDVYRDKNPDRGLKPGDDFDWILQTEIKNRDIFLSILTCHAVRRPQGWCLDEIAYARTKDRKIIPLLVENRSKEGNPCEPPLCIHRLNFIDAHLWKGSYDQILNQVISGIHKPQQYDGLSIRLLSGKGPDLKEYEYDFSKELIKKTRNFIGRGWLLSRIDEWLNQSENQVLLLTGDPGSGKSALLAYLSQKHPAVRAVHFFMNSWDATSDPRRFIGSLALMLASQITAYRKWLESRDDYSEFFNQTPRDMFKDLIINPLKEEWAGEKPFLILFDALDESYERDQSGIVQILSEGFRSKDIPRWIRFLISSRPVPRILSAFDGYPRYDLIDSNPLENSEDVRGFLVKFFKQTRLIGIRANWKKDITPEALTDLLLTRSEGNFLYISYITDDILEERIDPSTEEMIPTGLYEYYTLNFERLFPDLEKYQQEVRPVLDLLFAAREPLDISYIVDILDLTPREVLFRIQPLLPFIEMTKNGEDPEFRPFHTTFTEWITGKGFGESIPVIKPELPDSLQRRQSGSYPVDYQVDLMLGNRRISSYLEEKYKRKKTDRFLLSHLPYHLYNARQYDAYLKMVLDPAFMEAKISHPGLGIQSLINDLTIGVDGPELKKQITQTAIRALRLIRDALRLSSHALLKDPAQFATQMFGRLLGFEEQLIKEFLNRVNEEQKGPWLIPLRQVFTTPGGPLIRILEGHTGQVTSVAISSDGKIAVSGSRDKTVRVWDLQTGQTRNVLKGHFNDVESVAFTPDGMTIIFGSVDSTLRIWNLLTNEIRTIFIGQLINVRSVAISPDCQTVLLGCTDGIVRICNILTGEIHHILKGHERSVESVVISLDGTTAISGSKDKTIRVWDIQTGETKKILNGHTDYVTSVVLGSDWKIISGSADGTIRIWDFHIGECQDIFKGHTHWVHSISLDPDGNTIISGSADRTVRVWDLRTGDIKKTFKGHTGEITSVAVSSEGHIAISGSEDKTIRVWDLQTREIQHESEIHTDLITSMAISPDGRTAVSGSADSTAIVWDVKTGDTKYIFKEHTGWVRAVAISPDGKTALSGCDDWTIRVWDIQTGQLQNKFDVYFTKRDSLEVIRLNSLLICQDNRTVLSECDDKTVRVWDLHTREIQQILEHTHVIGSVAISPDGKTVISGSWDNFVRVWNLQTGEIKFLLKGHFKDVNCVVISPDGRAAISGSDDKTVRVWDLQAGNIQHILRGHTGGISSVAVSPDGKTIISGSIDKTIKLWDLLTGACILTIQNEAPIRSLCISQSRIVLGDASGKVLFFIPENLTKGIPIITARKNEETLKTR